jgi:hypothetical protein
LEATQEAMPSGDLQEWLECQDFIVAMKAYTRCVSPVNVSSLLNFKIELQPVWMYAKFPNQKIRAQISEYDTDYWDALSCTSEMADAVSADIATPVDQLKAASLYEKRKVLRYMQIFSPAVSAAVLGTTEDFVNELKGPEYEDMVSFGGKYAGAHCYSMAELELVASNKVYVNDRAYTSVFRKTSTTQLYDCMLDYVLLVDTETAMAFTDMTKAELNANVPQVGHSRRPYRLADLEKIRVAKLKASH